MKEHKISDISISNDSSTIHNLISNKRYVNREINLPAIKKNKITSDISSSDSIFEKIAAASICNNFKDLAKQIHISVEKNDKKIMPFKQSILSTDNSSSNNKPPIRMSLLKNYLISSNQSDKLQTKSINKSVQKNKSLRKDTNDYDIMESEYNIDNNYQTRNYNNLKSYYLQVKNQIKHINEEINKVSESTIDLSDLLFSKGKLMKKNKLGLYNNKCYISNSKYISSCNKDENKTDNINTFESKIKSKISLKTKDYNNKKDNNDINTDKNYKPIKANVKNKNIENNRNETYDEYMSKNYTINNCNERKNIIINEFNEINKINEIHDSISNLNQKNERIDNLKLKIEHTNKEKDKLFSNKQEKYLKYLKENLSEDKYNNMAKLLNVNDKNNKNREIRKLKTKLKKIDYEITDYNIDSISKNNMYNKKLIYSINNPNNIKQKLIKMNISTLRFNKNNSIYGPELSLGDVFYARNSINENNLFKSTLNTHKKKILIENLFNQIKPNNMLSSNDLSKPQYDIKDYVNILTENLDEKELYYILCDYNNVFSGSNLNSVNRIHQKEDLITRINNEDLIFNKKIKNGKNINEKNNSNTKYSKQDIKNKMLNEKFFKPNLPKEENGDIKMKKAFIAEKIKETLTLEKKIISLRKQKIDKLINPKDLKLNFNNHKRNTMKIKDKTLKTYKNSEISNVHNQNENSENNNLNVVNNVINENNLDSKLDLIPQINENIENYEKNIDNKECNIEFSKNELKNDVVEFLNKIKESPIKKVGFKRKIQISRNYHAEINNIDREIRKTISLIKESYLRHSTKSSKSIFK